jgi:hypothetical protein
VINETKEIKVIHEKIETKENLEKIDYQVEIETKETKENLAEMLLYSLNLVKMARNGTQYNLKKQNT